MSVPSSGSTKAASTGRKTRFVVQSAKLEVLIGGPYVKDGVEHPYGHAALRVAVGETDLVYDFGRYGKTWGTGSSEGEGMLRVWRSFDKYIAGENATGRKTMGYEFKVTKAQANNVVAHFDALVAKGTVSKRRGGYMIQYKLARDYHALTHNCTTMSISGAQAGLRWMGTSAGDFNEGRGLGFTERAAAHLAGWPDDLFMPADLSAYLSAQSGPQAAKQVHTYGGR